MNILVRLYRALPLAMFLLSMAVVAYFVVSRLTSPDRAKVLLLRLFILLTVGLTAVFTAGVGYAYAEGNAFAAEVIAAFAVLSALAIVITLICRSVFLKHRPDYQKPSSGFWSKFI